jgi:hypothetical protein
MPEQSSEWTPAWCGYCKCYVPLEREPHVSPHNRLPHNAKDQPWKGLGNDGPLLPEPEETRP